MLKPRLVADSQLTRTNPYLGSLPIAESILWLWLIRVRLHRRERDEYEFE